MKATLNHHILKTPSGLLHPFYSVTSALRSRGPEMYAKASVHPPLDHETIIPLAQTEVTFIVSLETGAVDAAEPEVEAEDHWQVQVWHDHHKEGGWEALTLSRVPNGARTTRGLKSASAAPRWFTGKLHRPTDPSKHLTHFTVRFRNKTDETWRWVKDATGVPDGEVIFQGPLPQETTPIDLIDGLGSDVKWSKQQSDTSDTSVWLLESPVAAAEDPKSGWSTSTLGLPKNFTRWFSLVRLWSPWLAPRHGRGTPFAEKDGLLYAFQRKDGLHLVAIAVSGLDNVQTMLVDENGKLAIRSRNDRQSEGTARVCLALAKTFDEANAAAFYLSRKLVSQFLPVTTEHQEVLKELMKRETTKDVKATWAEDWYDGFTYCTWNGLGQDLTEEKVRRALTSLESNGISISNLIIDDNWQTLDNAGQNQFVRGWRDFEANQEGWPQGIKAAAASIRQKHPSIKHIGVWHAIMGYWGGISPAGNIAKKYQTRDVKRIGIRPGVVKVVDDADVGQMYKDFYSFLEASGIDSVKTDVQFALDELDESSARRDLTNAYLNAWNIAQLRYMSAHAISCMSQVPQIIFHSQLPQHTPALIVRNSDDFFPNVPESHPWHIFCNAHNSLLTKHLNALPDWDMFQTVHPWSGFHAAGRCVSGGPIYITDEPGKHDIALISQMTAKTTRGQTVVLRPSTIGRSISQYVGYEDERILFVGAFNGYAASGSSFMGVFNCRPHEITELLHLDQWLGTQHGEWLIRSHQTGEIGLVVSCSRPDEAVEAVTVPGGGWDVLTARPVVSVKHPGNSSPVRVADFGLLGQMTGAAAILSSTATFETSRLQLKTSLKALGTWGFWVDQKMGPVGDSLVLIGSKPVPVECVHIPGNGMVEVDLERAWNEMGLSSGYSNELDVTAFVKLAGN